MRYNTQEAPYPVVLEELVRRLRYRRHLGWNVSLVEDYQRDQPGCHSGESRGLTLIVTRIGSNTYDPSEPMEVNHLFPVPPATYDRRAWQRWLFDRLGDVDTHERMEDFAFVGPDDFDQFDSPRYWYRPYKPVHAPGADPYTVTELSTDLERRTSFRGDVSDS